MKRPLLGILIVISLHLGFTAYNAIDRPIEALVAVNEVTSGTNPIASVFEDPDSAGFLNADSTEGPGRVYNGESSVATVVSRKPSAATTLFSNRRAAMPRPAKAVTGTPQFVALKKPSETRLRTEYPSAMPIDRESYQLSAKAVPRSGKKSFISKTASVLKKPYDWMKTLVGKIK